MNSGAKHQRFSCSTSLAITALQVALIINSMELYSSGLIDILLVISTLKTKTWCRV